MSSLLFYAWGETWFVLVMLTSTLIDYARGLVISGQATAWGEPIRALGEGARNRRQKAALVAPIVADLSILGVFKCFNFGIDN
jgi:alginate O-acetyltransferase complex protein AlgI